MRTSRHGKTERRGGNRIAAFAKTRGRDLPLARL
nr:MAG TPA: hypothetical protein [Herelleviridae sp.]